MAKWKIDDETREALDYIQSKWPVPTSKRMIARIMVRDWLLVMADKQRWFGDSGNKEVNMTEIYNLSLLKDTGVDEEDEEDNA
jgi:hypothetical protein